MIEPPELATTTASLGAVVSLAIPRSEMTTAVPAAIGELHRVIAAQGIAATGPLFTYYPRRPGERFEFNVGLPVARAVAAAGRVTPGGLPASRVACTVYCGDYRGLPDAWAEFAAWIRRAGHGSAPEFWEVYRVSPNDADPAGWRTELVQVLA